MDIVITLIIISIFISNAIIDTLDYISLNFNNKFFNFINSLYVFQCSKCSGFWISLILVLVVNPSFHMIVVPASVYIINKLISAYI